MNRPVPRSVAALLVTVVLGAVLLLATPARADTGTGTGTGTDDDVRRLLERHVPVVMIRTPDRPCGEAGEPFRPVAVDAVLDNPQIALRQSGRNDPVVRWAPGAADLFGLGEGFYLDFPGEALTPGCLYERDAGRFTGGRPTVVYGRVATQPDRPGELVAQYWLYWYFNDWNNKHESDWEFVQLVFRASSPQEALATDPVAVGYAQHEGGEFAGWDDEKLERDGSRPVVYSSRRSHASYFGSALFLGRGASEGFGCDNTDGPSTRLDPDVVVLPSAPAGAAGDPHAWTAFEGRWGERRAGPNNGPTGPPTKRQWDHPLDWQDDLRPASFVVPAGDTAAESLVGSFCSVVTWGSRQLVGFEASPVRLLLVVAVVAVAARSLGRRTRWDPVPPLPLVHARRAGQALRSAAVLVRRHPGPLAVIGCVAVPVIVAGLALGLVWSLVGGATGAASAGGRGAGDLTAASLQGGMTTLFAATLIRAVTARWLADGPAPGGVRTAVAVVRGRAVALLAVSAALNALFLVLHVSVLAVPVALWLAVRWLFLPEVMAVEGLPWRAGLRRSATLTRRRRWSIAVIVFPLAAVVSLSGVAVGLLTLVAFTGLPLWLVSAVGGLTHLLLLPPAALVTAFLYGDAVASDTGGVRQGSPAERYREPV